MNANVPGAVVVGVDGSAASLRAVAVAAGQARSLGVPLRIVHAYLWPGHASSAGVDLRARTRVDALLADARARAQAAAADVEVRTVAAEGTDFSILSQESQSAAMLVIGHRGLGSTAGLLTGAAGMRLAGRTGCPLLVVRGEAHEDGPVVVGVELSRTTDEVLHAAFRQARSSGRGVVAVHAWEVPGYLAGVPGALYGAALAGRSGIAAVHAAVARAASFYPEVMLSAVEIRYGRPVAALAEVAAGASLLVVGSRGAGGFRGLVLGSVSMGAVAHAPCPVLVIPDGRAAEAVPGPRPYPAPNLVTGC